MKEMGAHIRALRKRQGMTQEEMAERCGLHWTYIGGLERGERNPTSKTLNRIAEGLAIAPSKLVSSPPVKVTKEQSRRRELENKLAKVLRNQDVSTLALTVKMVKLVTHWNSIG